MRGLIAETPAISDNSLAWGGMKVLGEPAIPCCAREVVDAKIAVAIKNLPLSTTDCQPEMRIA